MKKIIDWSSLWMDRFCKDPGHNPPSMVVLTEGIWQHTCPKCRKVQHIVIPPKDLAMKQFTL